MFSGLLKLFVFSVTGAAGIGASTPLIYIATTQAKYRILWKKTLNNIDPIISCDGHDAKYSVKMTFSEHEDKDLGFGATFQLVKSETNYFGRDTKTKTETRSSNIEAKRKWGFKGNWSDSGGGVGVWYDGKWSSGGKEQERITKCDEKSRKITWEGKDRRNYEEVDASSIKLEAVNCKGWFTKTCDIQLSSNSGLKWSETFKPTVFYSPF